MPYPRQNCIETIPFTASHTYIAHIWECLPPPPPDLMVSALDSGSSGSGSSPGRGRSWARHFTLIVVLSTQVYKWVLANLLLGVTLRWTSIPSLEGRNTPKSLHDTGISSGGVGHLARHRLYSVGSSPIFQMCYLRRLENFREKCQIHKKSLL